MRKHLQESQRRARKSYVSLDIDSIIIVIYSKWRNWRFFCYLGIFKFSPKTYNISTIILFKISHNISIHFPTATLPSSLDSSPNTLRSYSFIFPFQLSRPHYPHLHMPSSRSYCTHYVQSWALPRFWCIFMPELFLLHYQSTFTFRFENYLIEFSAFDWLWLFGQLTVDVNNHSHVIHWLLHFFRKKRNLYFE